MARYYVSDHPNLNGDHDVHVSGCKNMHGSMVHLGEHSLCTTAVARAKSIFVQVNGCKYCSNLCHSCNVS
jgi:hypothetical protein